MDTHRLTEPFRLNKQQRFRKQKFMLGGLSVAALNKFFTGSNFEFEWIEVFSISSLYLRFRFSSFVVELHIFGEW